MSIEDRVAGLERSLQGALDHIETLEGELRGVNEWMADQRAREAHDEEMVIAEAATYRDAVGY
jgi:hypothetical protein